MWYCCSSVQFRKQNEEKGEDGWKEGRKGGREGGRKERGKEGRKGGVTFCLPHRSLYKVNEIWIPKSGRQYKKKIMYSFHLQRMMQTYK